MIRVGDRTLRGDEFGYWIVSKVDADGSETAQESYVGLDLALRAMLDGLIMDDFDDVSDLASLTQLVGQQYAAILCAVQTMLVEGLAGALGVSEVH